MGYHGLLQLVELVLAEDFSVPVVAERPAGEDVVLTSCIPTEDFFISIV